LPPGERAHSRISRAALWRGTAALLLGGKDGVNGGLRPLPAPDEIEHSRPKIGRGRGFLRLRHGRIMQRIYAAKKPFVFRPLILLRNS